MNCESLSERIIESVICRLREVRQADGYRTDAGLRVFDSVRALSDDDLPCFVVWEQSEGVTGGSGSGPIGVALTIAVEAHTAANQKATGTELRAMKADAKKALLRGTGAVGLTDSGKAIAVLQYTGAQSFPREDGDSDEAVTLTFAANFKEAYGDPYASR